MKILKKIGSFLDKNKTQITAVIVVLILASGYVIVNTNKLNEQKRITAKKERVAHQERLDESFNQIFYEGCVDDADDAYHAYAKLNGTVNDDGSIWAMPNVWDNARKDRQNSIKNCYDQYKR